MASKTVTGSIKLKEPLCLYMKSFVRRLGYLDIYTVFSGGPFQRVILTFFVFETRRETSKRVNGSQVLLSSPFCIRILGLQPRDKAAMLGVKTKEYFLEEFT